MSKENHSKLLLPIPKGPPIPSVPGTKLRWLNPSIVYGTVAEDLPLANSSLVFFLASLWFGVPGLLQSSGVSSVYTIILSRIAPD